MEWVQFFHNHCTRGLLIVGGGGKCSKDSMGTQTFQKLLQLDNARFF